MADWDESEHPRHPDGRFRDKAGGGWVGALSDRIRGGSRYRRVEGRDLSEQVITRAGDFVYTYLNPNTYGDEVVQEIAHMQGFDGLPTVGTAAELDEAIAEGGTELWRGYRGSMPIRSILSEPPGEIVHLPGSAVAYAEQWRSGDYTAGSGIYGQGTYMSVDRRVAQHWGLALRDADNELIYEPDADPADNPQVGLVFDPRTQVRSVLSPDARVIDYHDDRLKAYMRQLYAGITPESLREAVRRRVAEDAGMEPDDVELSEDQWERALLEAKKQAMALLGDRGRAAAALGFDAMHVPSGEKYGDGSDYDAPQYVIFNRTALLVQEAYDENLLPPEVIRTWETRRD